MSSILDEDLLYFIYSIVEEIPEGKVATYGQLARLAGIPKKARLVGKALKYSSLLCNFVYYLSAQINFPQPIWVFFCSRLKGFITGHY